MNIKQQEKVYIAGAVKGQTPFEVKCKFDKAADRLRKMGYDVINPVTVIQEVNDLRFMAKLDPLSDDIPGHRKMIFKHCISALAHCDVIYLLECWTSSKGACLEKDIAERMGMKIMYQKIIK